MANVVVQTICDMVEQARLRLDDLSVVVVAEPTSNLDLITQAAEDADEGELLWKTHELRTYANQAIREVAIRTLCLRDSARNKAGVTTYPITAPNSVITIDERVMEIKRVWFDGRVIFPDSVLFLDECSTSWRTESKSNDRIEQFVLDRSSRDLQLVGLPQVDGVIELDVIHEPWDQIEKGTPEIPQRYLFDAVHWMCHLAYLKNDADTRDPNKAAENEQEFEKVFGPRQTELQLQLRYHARGGKRRGRLRWF